MCQPSSATHALEHDLSKAHGEAGAKIASFFIFYSVHGYIPHVGPNGHTLVHALAWLV